MNNGSNRGEGQTTCATPTTMLCGSTRPPNILLIVCDQLRADALGCFGNSIVQTPHIDCLA